VSAKSGTSLLLDTRMRMDITLSSQSASPSRMLLRKGGRRGRDGAGEYEMVGMKGNTAEA